MAEGGSGSVYHSGLTPKSGQRKLRKYAVVEFSDGVAVVSSTWIRIQGENQEKCYWPGNKTLSRVRKMAKDNVPVNKEEWTFHDVSVLGDSDDWDRVLEKEKQSQDTSSLETEEEEGMRRRQSRPPLRYINDSSEEEVESMDEDDDTHVNHHLPKAPKVPPSNKRATVSAMSSSANRMLSPVNRQDCGTQRRDVEERTCSTTATPNTGFEKTVVKLLTEVTLGMKSLQKNVEQNTSLLMELISRGSAATAEIDAIDLELPTELPLKAVNDLEALDAAAAEDPALAKKLVSKLAVLGGGKDTTSTTKAIMNNLFDPELARLYNWTGVKGKRVFQTLNLVKVVLRAVRRNPRTKEATKEEVKEVIKQFLYNARDRNGGRKARNARPQVEAATEDTDEA